MHRFTIFDSRTPRHPVVVLSLSHDSDSAADSQASQEAQKEDASEARTTFRSSIEREKKSYDPRRHHTKNHRHGFHPKTTHSLNPTSRSSPTLLPTTTHAAVTMRLLISLAVLLGALFYGTSSFLQTQEPLHFIFDPARLHAIAQQSVHAHGNDTGAMVAEIVGQLRQDDALAPYLSVEEEWIFNNAGGAMGAMYLIHASKSKQTSFRLGMEDRR